MDEPEEESFLLRILRTFSGGRPGTSPLADFFASLFSAPPAPVNDPPPTQPFVRPVQLQRQPIAQTPPMVMQPMAEPPVVIQPLVQPLAQPLAPPVNPPALISGLPATSPPQPSPVKVPNIDADIARGVRPGVNPTTVTSERTVAIAVDPQAVGRAQTELTNALNKARNVLNIPADEVVSVNNLAIWRGRAQTDLINLRLRISARVSLTAIPPIDPSQLNTVQGIASAEASKRANWTAMVASLQAHHTQLNGVDLATLSQEEASERLREARRVQGNNANGAFTTALATGPSSGRDHYQAYLNADNSYNQQVAAYRQVHGNNPPTQAELSIQIQLIISRNAAAIQAALDSDPEVAALQARVTLLETHENITHRLARNLHNAQNPGNRTETSTSQTAGTQPVFVWSDALHRDPVTSVITAVTHNHNLLHPESRIVLPTDPAGQRALIESVKNDPRFQSYTSAQAALVANERTGEYAYLQAYRAYETASAALTQRQAAYDRAASAQIPGLEASAEDLRLAREAVDRSNRAVATNSNDPDARSGQTANRQHLAMLEQRNRIHTMVRENPERVRDLIDLSTQYRDSHGGRNPTQQELRTFAWEQRNSNRPDGTQYGTGAWHLAGNISQADLNFIQQGDNAGRIRTHAVSLVGARQELDQARANYFGSPSNPNGALHVYTALQRQNNTSLTPAEIERIDREHTALVTARDNARTGWEAGLSNTLRVSLGMQPIVVAQNQNPNIPANNVAALTPEQQAAVETASQMVVAFLTGNTPVGNTSLLGAAPGTVSAPNANRTPGGLT